LQEEIDLYVINFLLSLFFQLFIYSQKLDFSSAQPITDRRHLEKRRLTTICFIALSRLTGNCIPVGERHYSIAFYRIAGSAQQDRLFTFSTSVFHELPRPLTHMHTIF